MIGRAIIVLGNPQEMTEKTAGRTLPLLIYFLIAAPFEFLGTFLSIHRLMYANWLLLLNLGPLVQAIVVLAFLLSLRSLSARGKEEATAEPFARRGLLITLGIVVGLLTAWAWWQFFRYATNASGQQDYILGRRPFSLGYYPGTLSGGIGFALAFSVFVAIYLGFAGGELAARWSPKRRLFVWAVPRANRSELAWELWISWLVTYRLFWMLFLSLSRAFSGSQGSGSVGDIFVVGAPYLATALICISVSRWLARRAPTSRTSAIGGSMGASVLVNLLAALLLLPFGFLGLAMIFSPLYYIPGFAWGWLASELRWRSLQLQQLTAAAK